jgi:hypothetical protein
MNIAFMQFKLRVPNNSSRVTFILACRHTIATCMYCERQELLHFWCETEAIQYLYITGEAVI